MKSLLCPALLGALATTTHANLVGLWKFDDSTNLGKATFGTDLVIGGVAPTYSASLADGLSNSQTGVITTATLPMLAIVLPAMLIPTLLGTRLYIGISDAAFRRIVLGLLTASGIAMLAAALPRLL